MNGFRTRNRSESTPIRITARTLKPHSQLPSPFEALTEKLNTVVM